MAKNNIYKKKSKDIICTYSAIEQKRHGIAGPLKCLIVFLGIFPFTFLALELYSCFAKRISGEDFKKCMFLITGVLSAIMLICIVKFVIRIFYVFIIDEAGNVYRLRISNFWYKIKNQTVLLNPMETSMGRTMRIFYMISNIKLVLDNITDTVTYEELIAMGKLYKFENISDIKVTERKIVFRARVNGAEIDKYIKIERVYENDCQLIHAIRGQDIPEKESATDIIKEITSDKTPVKKLIRFTVRWTCVMAWIAVIALSNDLGKLSRINAGEYKKGTIEVLDKNNKNEVIKKEAYISVKNESDYFYVDSYGKAYAPVLIIYGAVEFMYALNKVIDMLNNLINRKY